MTQEERLLQMFRDRGNKLTLGEIMQTTLAAEYRARMTDLRHRGYIIECERRQPPSLNLYSLSGPKIGLDAVKPI